MSDFTVGDGLEGDGGRVMMPTNDELRRRYCALVVFQAYLFAEALHRPVVVRGHHCWYRMAPRDAATGPDLVFLMVTPG